MNGNFKKTKKVLAASLGTLMLIQGAAIGATAAEIDPGAVVFVRPSVTEVECEQIGMNYIYVNVKTADSENDEPAMAYLIDEAGKLCSVANAGIRGNEATIKLGIPDSVPTGDYTVVVAVNKAGKTTSQDVFYVGTQDVEGFFEAINLTDADVNELTAKLRQHCVAFSVVEYATDVESGKKLALDANDYESLTKEEEKAFAELILSAINGKYADMKGSFDETNSEAFLKEALVLAVYNTADKENPGEALTNYLYKFDSTVGFNSEDSTLYAKIEDKKTLAKIAKTMTPTAESVEEIKEAISGAAGVQLINETYLYNVVDAIAAQNDLFQVDESQLKALKNNKTLRNYFCEYMSKTYYSVDEIRESWADAYKAAKKKVESQTAGGPGSSSSGSDSKVTLVSVDTSLINVGTKKTISDYYTDMGDYAWAAEGVLDLTEAGIVSGYGDGTFGPANNLTRAEFMKMLVNALGLADVTATCSFTDVSKDSWAYVYIASAEKLGLASGYGNGLFGVNDPITREDMVTLVYRAAKLKKVSISRYTVGTISFTDQNQISSYATEAVKALYNTGLYLGTSDGSKVTTFEPKSNASRAFAAVVLDKVYSIK